MISFAQVSDAGEAVYRFALMSRAARGSALKFRPPLRQSMGLALHGLGAIATLDMGVSLALAPSGHRLAYASGSVAGVTGGVLGTAIGTTLGGPVGGLVGGLAGDWLARTPVMKGMEYMARIGRDIRRLDVGDGRGESQVAYTMRQRAAQELGRSLVNARMYLGKEALLMHQ